LLSNVSVRSAFRRPTYCLMAMGLCATDCPYADLLSNDKSTVRSAVLMLEGHLMTRACNRLTFCLIAMYLYECNRLSFDKLVA